MNRRQLACLALIVLWSGCTPDASDRFVMVTDVQGIMAHVVDPAADTYWDAVGWIEDAEEGTIEIRPTSPEEWATVVNAAYTVAEAGNLIMMEGRARDDGAWMGMSQAMIEAAERAIEAAEAQNEAAVFDTGAELYYTCSNCHSTYVDEIVRPNAAGGSP